MSFDPTQINDQVAHLNKQLADYTGRFNTVVNKGLEPAIKAQADLASLVLESAIAHGEKLTQATSAQQVLDEQSALMKDLTEDFQDTAKVLLLGQQVAGAEMKTLLEEGVEMFTPDAVEQLFKQGLQESSES